MSRNSDFSFFKDVAKLSNPNERLKLYEIEEVKFIHYLISDTANQNKWLRQKRRKIDLSSVSKQKEEWDIEIDWDYLCNKAEQDFDIKLVNKVPFPLFLMRRFVATDYVPANNEIPVEMTHRSENNTFASFILCYNIYHFCDRNLSLPVENELFVSWFKTFSFGGNYTKTQEIDLFKQQEIFFEKSVTNTQKAIAPFFDANKYINQKYISSFKVLSKAYRDQYPVLVFLPVTTGRKTYKFNVIRRGANRASLNDPDEIDLRHAHDSKDILYWIMRFSLFLRFHYTRQWLGNSSFLELTFPQDCRAVKVVDSGLEQDDCQTVSSENELFSAVSKKNSTGTESLSGWIIPKFRIVAPLLPFAFLEILVLVAHIVNMKEEWRNWTNNSFIYNISIVIMGATLFFADKSESSTVTKMVFIPRFCSFVLMSFNIIELCLLFSESTEKQGVDCIAYNYNENIIFALKTLVNINVIFLLILIVWLCIYLLVRFFFSGTKSPRDLFRKLDSYL